MVVLDSRDEAYEADNCEASNSLIWWSIIADIGHSSCLALNVSQTL